jgi:RNA polymerase sigma-70 factor (ECF subfamily)
LHRVALNLCYSRLGRRRLKTNPIGELELATLRDVAVGPSELAERKELRQAVREGVAALPPKHQSVVVLYYLHGLSLQETSTILGIRLGTVKSRLHYALGSLRTHLASEGRSVEADTQIRPVEAEVEAEAEA